MKRILVALFSLLTSIHSWGCYYDFSTHVNWCSTQHNGTGVSVLVNCSYGGTQSNRIVCVYGLGTFPYDTGQNICLYGNTQVLNVFQVCPGGSAPSKTPPKITPNFTANSCGSIIRTDTQVLSESINLTDAPFSLSYSSDRAIGRKDWYKTSIPITSSSFYGHPNISSENLTVAIAGQVTHESFTPAANLSYDFLWDGKDGGGSTVSGSHEATITVSEEYDFNPGVLDYLNTYEYMTLSTGPYVMPFGHTSITTKIILGSIFGGSTGLNGWDINIRHHYDPVRKSLYLGDGSTFNTEAIVKNNGDYWVVSSDRSLIFVFDSSFNHLETKDALTGVLLFTFSYTSGLLTKVEDKYGNETTFQYSGSNLTSITSPFGHVTHITTNANGYIETVSSPASEVHEMTYTSDGLLLTFEKPSGTTSTMTYDQYGLLLTDSNSAGNSTTLDRDEIPDGFKITETSSLGRERVHSISINGSQYNRSETRTNQTSKYYGMDFVSKRLSTSGTGAAAYSEYSTTDPRFLGQKMPYYFSVSDGSTKTVTYNEIVSLSNPSDPFSFATLTKAWTSNGKTKSSVYTVSTDKIVNTSPLGKTINSTLNAKGDIASIQVASLLPVSYSYNTNGRIETITQGTRDTTFSYNTSTGFLSSVENALGQATSFTHDLVGRILTQTLPNSRVVTYSYDSNGNISSITPPGRPAHEMTYNGLDYLASYIPPTVQAPNNVTTSYTYSNDRELTHITRPDAQVVEFNYGINGNLNSIDLPTGTRTFSYNYGLMNGSISEDYFSRYSSYNGSRISYDHISALGFSYYFTNSFNNELLPSAENLVYNSVNYPLGFTYDNDNLLITAGDASYARSSSTGALENFTIGDMDQSYNYSTSFGELSSIESIYNASTTTYQVSFARDDLGRITQKTEQYGGGSSDSYVYTYDSAGRLTNVSLNGNLLSSFTYDSNSNRTSQTISGVTTNATYDDQDRLLTFGTKSFSYNLNGEVTSITDSATSQTFSITYDALGNLKSVVLPTKTVNYKVDAHNRRMAKLDGATIDNYFIWNSSDQLIGVTDSSGNLIDRYVYGSKGHVPDYVEKGSDKFQIVTNHLGSPVQVINADTGVIAQEVKYDEFGQIISDTNPGFTVFGFAGCLYDNDTKLCRFGARDYDASIGRWLSKDPILFAGGDTNLYGYVMQDPINWIDPNGMTAQDVQDAINYVAANYGMTPASYSFGAPSSSNAMAVPFANHIFVSDKYSKNLTDTQKQNLLQTIRHEFQHINDGFFKSIMNSKSQHEQIDSDAFKFSLRNINSFLEYQRKGQCSK